MPHHQFNNHRHGHHRNHNRIPSTALTRTVDATVEPLTFEEAQSYLRIDEIDDRGLVESLIQAARIRAEVFTNRAFITQTWTLKADDFGDLITFDDIIEIPKPPLISVVVQFIDVNEVLQTFSSAKYVVDIDSELGRIKPIASETWPNTFDTLNAVTITFVAGYGAAASDVPSDLIHAIRFLIGHWYENREEVLIGKNSTKLPEAAEMLLWQKRILSRAI